VFIQKNKSVKKSVHHGTNPRNKTTSKHFTNVLYRFFSLEDTPSELGRLWRAVQFRVEDSPLLAAGSFNGLEASKTMKALDPLAYIIIMTGYATLDNVRKGKEFGIREFLVKPFSQQ